jgi:hypothetical protein
MEICETEVLRRYQAGETSTTIGKSVGRSYATILNIVRRNGGEVRTAKQASPIKYDREKVGKDYESGLSLSEVAAIHGTSASTIWAVLKAAGKKTRSREESVKRGKDHPLWKGGRKDRDRYKILPEGREHRIAATQMLGRLILGWEDVHHVDSNREDNSESNLVVMPGRERVRFHSFLRRNNIPATREALDKYCRRENLHYYRFTAKDFAKCPGRMKTQRKQTTPCRIRSCPNFSVAKGLCSVHYQRKRAIARGAWKSGSGRTSACRLKSIGTVKAPRAQQALPSKQSPKTRRDPS